MNPTRTIRARLLAVMALIVVPIALASIVLAASNYRAATRAIAASEIQTASDFTIRTRIWFRGVVRLVIAAVQTTRTLPASAGFDCNRGARAMLDGMDGFEAILLRLDGERTCFASLLPGLDAGWMGDLATSQRGKPLLPSGPAQNLANANYGFVERDGVLRVVVYVRNTDAAGPAWEGLMLVAPRLLERVFESGPVVGADAVALMSGRNHVLVARGVDAADKAWLPREEKVSDVGEHRKAEAGDGQTYTFVTRMVTPPDLYVLARFNHAAESAAATQFVMQSVTPVAILAILFLVFAWAIQSNVIRWVTRIEQAARRRFAAAGAQVLVPLDPRMPDDVRSVAVAFNSMVLEADRREAALLQSAEARRLLMRELHHRVKNSLQIIQSYIALSRRQVTGARGQVLAETEAKILVLSAAYRLALTDAGMRPVAIRPFLAEIVDNIAASLRQDGQQVTARIEVEVGLIVDRVIPLGLAVVEGATAAFEGGHPVRLEIACSGEADGSVCLAMRGAPGSNHAVRAPRILHGLALQLQASANPVAPPDILRWHFNP